MNATDWIDVFERRPRTSRYVLAYTVSGATWVARYSGGEWVAKGWGVIHSVTHWMDIVAPGNEEDK